MDDAKAAGNGYGPRAPRNGGDGVSADALEAAVSRGIITSEQRDLLLALRAESAGARHVPGAEATRGFNLVAVGYWAGSAAVLFALGWFLIDRWKSLQPGGVLVVALLYAIAFGLSSLLLSNLGFRIASGLLTLLTVGMAPIVAWSVESLLGIWPPVTRPREIFTTDLIATIRWIPIELSTALAGLIALRKVRFGMLTLTITIPAGLTLVHLTPWLFDPELDFSMWGWMAVLVATVMWAAGYFVEGRTRGDEEDYAAWVYLTGLGFLFVGFVAVADQSRAIPHSLPAIVALLVTLSLVLARRMFLLLAAIFFVFYLGFLAESVFPSAVGFLLVMCTAGVLLIFLTVLAQKKFPGLLRRLSADRRSAGPPHALRLLLPGLIIVALVLLVTSVPRARVRFDERVARQRQSIRQAGEARRAREAAQRARLREQIRRETPVRRAP